MADKMITTYNSHQSPTTDDKFFMVGASEEYLINYDLLASAILDKLTTKTYSGLNNSTVISALQANSSAIATNASDIATNTADIATNASGITALNSSSLSYNIEKYTSITSGTDLNTLTTYGQYRSASSTTTNSLAHCPVTGYGFILNVFPAGTAQFLCQEIFTTSSATASAKIVSYRRFVNVRDNLFGEWQSVETILSTNTANIATNTASIGTINSTLTTLTGTQASTTPTGTNLNTLTDTGIYQIGDLSQMTNGPTATGYGSLEVVRARTYILQRFIHMSSTAGATEYWRVSVNGGTDWRSWTYNATPKLAGLTIGNGTVMSFERDMTYQIRSEIYVNCCVAFSGARAKDALLIRLPSTVLRSQYIQMIKVASNGTQSAWVSMVTVGTGDINCPTAFASGDKVYITGVITLF